MLSSLWCYRRIHLAVLAGVVVATAVITGALLVGNSVRGSLHDLSLDRLGTIDHVLVAEQPFREALADPFAKLTQTAPLLLVTGSLTAKNNGLSRHATGLSILGCTPGFWTFDSRPPPAPLVGNQIALAEPLADELGVGVGSEILLRVPRVQNLPADSTLGEKNETTTFQRMQVAAVLTDRGLASFSLRPAQTPQRNVFVPLEVLQRMLDCPARINAVAIGAATDDQLQSALQPTLEDFNIRTSQAKSGILSITAKRLVVPTEIVDEVHRALPQTDIQPVITYLANTIKAGERQIPYSTISGVHSLPQLGPLLDETGQPILLADDEILLNDWAAHDLQVQVGDTITLTYYEPETTHGLLQEASPVRLRLHSIVPLMDQDQKPTAASDPQLTPQLPGVTDQQSIRNWELPFELIEPIRPQDEEYWDKYSTTPKAFVSYALAARLWHTRWGTESVLRIPQSENLSASELQQRIAPNPEKNGMFLVPLRTQGLAASQGTTGFAGLFLGFSFFLMASAVMLIALLFRLGTEGRATEAGLLSAIGWNHARLRRAWLGEAAVLAVLGAFLGSMVGIVYARLLIHGLTTWWVSATVTPFIELHVSSSSLLLGFFLGTFFALLTITWSTSKLLQIPSRQLLAGDCRDHYSSRRKNLKDRVLPLLLLVSAILLAAAATRMQGEAQAGAFFGCGVLVLLALLFKLTGLLNKTSSATFKPFQLSLVGLALCNTRRHPGRTLLSVALIALASFLIVALSAFRLAPSVQGTGDFDLMATSDQPIHFDLNTPDGRTALGFTKDDEDLLGDTEFYSLRVRDGEDASCLNLYQTTQPRIIGVPKSFYNHNQFAWSAKASQHMESPWQLLDSSYDDHEIVPVVLDKSTSTYSLHLSGVGAQLTVRGANDRPITLQVAGLLTGSILQGKVLMSETRFLQHFPNTEGHRLFLLRRSQKNGSLDDLAERLESQLVDYGFDVISAEEKLAKFLAVQNTYLSTFQSLGALGLLLGTLGLAVAQIRSVLERRGELALLRSSGFQHKRLALLILCENGLILLIGLGIGCMAALVSLLPHWWLQAASIPWQTLALLLLTIAVVGLTAGSLAVRTTLSVPLLPALRGD